MDIEMDKAVYRSDGATASELLFDVKQRKVVEWSIFKKGGPKGWSPGVAV